MLNRIRESFIDPKELIKYRKDSIFKALGYMLFFALFMAAPMVIAVLTYQGVSNSARKDFMENSIPLETDCEIDAARLNCETPTQHTFYTMRNISFSINTETVQAPEDYDNYMFHIILHDNLLILYTRSFLGPMTVDVPISQLNSAIHNLDLNDLTNDPSLFEYAVFLAVDDLIISQRPIWGSVYAISSIISGIMMFLIFILLNTFLTRARLPMVPFKDMFVLMTYAGTALYIVLIFNSLWNFDFIIFIILLLVAFRQMNKLSMEIQKRVYRQ